MPALDFLLDPIAPATFFREFWDRKAVHIPGASDKFVGIYDAKMWADFEGVVDLKAVTTDKSGVQVETAALAHQAGVLFVAGFTICANVSNAPRLAAFLRDFRGELAMAGGPAFAKLYASGDGKGFTVHADSHHVFVLQISGQKLWRFSSTPVVASPTRGLFMRADGMPYWTDGHNRQPAAHEDGTPIAPPDPDSFDSAMLNPGDCLYLPPGTWHVARAVGHSIAVSISPQRAPATDVFLDGLHDLIGDRPGWRQDLLAAPTEQETAVAGELPAAVAAALDARLGELRQTLATVDPRHFHRLWLRDVAATQVVPAPGTGAGAAVGERRDELRRSTLLVRADGPRFQFVVAPDPISGEERCFFYRGDEFSLPLAARAVLAGIARHPEFRAEEALGWDRTLSFDNLRTYLATLVTAGVLRQQY